MGRSTPSSVDYSQETAAFFCPEIFLHILADRLASTASDFINIDLLHRFFSTFPHELNSRLAKRLENGDEGVEFARENKEVRLQIELQERKEKLELVMRELAALAYLKQQQNSDLHRGSDAHAGSSAARRNKKTILSSSASSSSSSSAAAGPPQSPPAVPSSTGRSSWSGLF